MGHCSFFDTLCNLRPFLALRQALNRKIDNKLATNIQPLNAAINEVKAYTVNLSHQLDASINALQGQLHQLNICSENRHREAMPLLFRSLEEHDRLLEDQAYTLYPGLHAALFPSFLAALKKISPATDDSLLPAAHLLLLEIAKDYPKLPGGIWQLNAEINAFTIPEPPPRPPAGQGPAPSDGPLRLLVISGMFPSIEHGGGLRLFDILHLLADAGHEIDLFAAYQPELDQGSRDLLLGKIAQTKLVSLEDFTASSLQTWLTAELGRSRGYYHVVQCEYPQSAKLLASARPFGRKIGFTFMECVTQSMLSKLRTAFADHDFPGLDRQVRLFWDFAVAEQQGARQTDFQIAVTPEDAAEVERLHGVRPEVIPTCLSPSQVIARLDAGRAQQPEGNTVVFLGFFDHFPNVDGVKWYLTNVHPLIKGQVEDYRFLVVGAGDTSQLQDISRHDPSVGYSGRVDDIMPYILRGKVCVLPLISGAGIRGKLNQYSMAGRPSVSTNIGNLGLNYADGESVLIADSPAAFAKAVVRLLTDDDFNRSVASRAKAHAEAHFTWDSHLARLVSIYRA